MKQWLILLGVVLCGAWPAFAQTVVAPDVLVKKVGDDTLALVRNDKDIRAGDRRKIFDLVQAKIVPYFDFARMTQLAMGKNWRQASPQQQATLASEFRTLLVYTYASAFSKYSDQTITVRPMRLQPDDQDVQVKTLIEQPTGGQPLNVDYNMEKTADGWKVYDVTIEGVRLVQNYRNTFNTEVQNGGIDGLIATLQNKNKMLAQGPAR